MKLIKIITLTAIVLTLSLGTVASAQETGADEIRTQVQNRQDMQRPPMKPLERRAEARKEMQGEKRDIRVEGRGEMRLAMGSTTASTPGMFKHDVKGIRSDIKKKMEIKQFEIRKDTLVKELIKSLANLNDITTRIEARITKAEQTGRTMTEPKALLVTAKQKIEVAKTEVAAFQALSASTTPPTGTATTTDVDLTKPRQAGDKAIKAVKEARDALQKVVVGIAHNMGLGEEKASTTPPRGPKPPKTVTSTTASTTTP